MPRFTQVFAPRDRVYFELFEKAGQNMLRAATLLHELLAGWPDDRHLAAEILDLEHKGDRITHDIIDRMNHTFVTPIDREDILALASAIDDVVDYVEEVADYLGLYKIEAPMEQSIRLARVLRDATEQISRALGELCGSEDIAPHTVEVNAIWGPDYVTGTPPASYYSNGTNANIVPVVQGYWTSFIRSFDPNVYRAPGTPTWEQWTGVGTQRLLFQTNNTQMEVVDAGLKERCAYLYSIGTDLRQ